MSYRTHNFRPYNTVLGRSNLPLLLTFTIGMVLSIAAAVAVQQWEHEHIRLAFEQDAYDSITAMQLDLQHHAREIHAINSPYKASLKVDRVDVPVHSKPVDALETELHWQRSSSI